MRRLSFGVAARDRELVLVEVQHVAVVEEAATWPSARIVPVRTSVMASRYCWRRALLVELVDLVEAAEAFCARSTSESSSEDCSCIRTVTKAPSATMVTAIATAMVVSSVTRLASDRR